MSHKVIPLGGQYFLKRGEVVASSYPGQYFSVPNPEYVLSRVERTAEGERVLHEIRETEERERRTRQEDLAHRQTLSPNPEVAVEFFPLEKSGRVGSRIGRVFRIPYLRREQVVGYKEIPQWLCQARRYKDGKICFPARGFSPEGGEVWLCRLEEREKVFLAHPISRLREVEVECNFLGVVGDESELYIIPGRHYGMWEKIFFFKKEKESG
jgi:hypothetical protein